MPPLVRPDERSTAFAHPCPRRCHPAHRRVPATGSAARPRRLHRRRHRRTDPPLHHRPRARRRPADRLQDPPRLPLPALRRGLPRRHLPAHPGRAHRRQGHSRHRRRAPVRLRHAHRAVVRPGPRPPGERRPGPGLPTAPEGQDLPARHRAVLRREAFPRRPPARRAAVPGLLRLHRGGPVQRLRARAVAPVHDHPPQGSGAQRRANWPGPRHAGPGLLRQGRRIPAAGRGPLPRHHPARRPRRANHGPALHGLPSPCSPPPSTRPPAPSASRRPPHQDSAPAPWPGAASSTSARSPPAAT